MREGSELDEDLDLEELGFWAGWGEEEAGFDGFEGAGEMVCFGEAEGSVVVVGG